MICVFINMTRTPEVTKSGFMEKPGIEPRMGTNSF